MTDPTHPHEPPDHPESPLAKAILQLAAHAEETTARVNDVDKRQTERLVGVGGVVGILVVLAPLIMPLLQPDKGVEESVRSVVRAEVRDTLDQHQRKASAERDDLLREIRALRADQAESMRRCVQRPPSPLDGNGTP